VTPDIGASTTWFGTGWSPMMIRLVALMLAEFAQKIGFMVDA
jgi:hypothetical protein